MPTTWNLVSNQTLPPSFWTVQLSGYIAIGVGIFILLQCIVFYARHKIEPIASRRWTLSLAGALCMAHLLFILGYFYATNQIRQIPCGVFFIVSNLSIGPASCLHAYRILHLILTFFKQNHTPTTESILVSWIPSFQNGTLGWWYTGSAVLLWSPAIYLSLVPDALHYPYGDIRCFYGGMIAIWCQGFVFGLFFSLLIPTLRKVQENLYFLTEVKLLSLVIPIGLSYHVFIIFFRSLTLELYVATLYYLINVLVSLTFPVWLSYRINSLPNSYKRLQNMEED